MVVVEVVVAGVEVRVVVVSLVMGSKERVEGVESQDAVSGAVIPACFGGGGGETRRDEGGVDVLS